MNVLERKNLNPVYKLTVSEFTTTTDFQGPKETVAHFFVVKFIKNVISK